MMPYEKWRPCPPHSACRPCGALQPVAPKEFACVPHPNRRPHQLGLEAARKIAFAWAEKAEEKLDMECTYEEGDDQDTVHFTRAGVNGTLQVYPDLFELDARLAGQCVQAPHRSRAEHAVRQAAGPRQAKPAKKSGLKKKRPVGRSMRDAAPPQRSDSIRSMYCCLASSAAVP